MEKEELRKLIQTTDDNNILAALWELYELKFCKSTLSVKEVIPNNPCQSGNGFIYSGKSITTATL